MFDFFLYFERLEQNKVLERHTQGEGVEEETYLATHSSDNPTKKSYRLQKCFSKTLSFKMKNEVYQPTATDNLTSAEDGENETYVPAQSISLLWKIVIAILLLLSIILMISLIVVSKKLKNQDDCPVCISCSTIATTTMQSITTANTTG